MNEDGTQFTYNTPLHQEIGTWYLDLLDRKVAPRTPILGRAPSRTRLRASARLVYCAGSGRFPPIRRTTRSVPTRQMATGHTFRAMSSDGS